jgi:hypothetical protein
MNRIEELRQQIDACRSGSDDLHLPELAGLARWVGEEENDATVSRETVAGELDRSQRFDRSVVSALHDVSVPAGLLERLLSKTAAAENGDSVDAVLSASVSNVVGESAVVPSDQAAVVAPAKSALSRRGWLLRAGSLGVVAAGLLGLAVALRPTQPRTISQAELAGAIPSWVEQTQDRTLWNKTPPPAAFQVNPIWTRRIVAWRSFPTNVAGETAIAYELTPGGGKVRLFVVKTPHKYAVPATPGLPLPGTTGGVQVSAWQPAGGLLYVLFIDRDGPPLERYLPRRTEA